MHICFCYQPVQQSTGQRGAACLTGRRFELIIHRRDTSGPRYPHIWEQSDPQFYAFFAGRIAGAEIGEHFPSGHAVETRDAASWTMDPEPDGSWIAVKFDRERDIVSFAADACLLQRWYYCQQGQAWFVANSLLYLKELLGSSLKVNAAAIPYILYREDLPGRYTPLLDVFGLRGREVLLFQAGKESISIRCAPFYLRRPQHDPQAAEQIAVNLKQAVTEELSGLASICLPLSGGMDSRFLFGCALEAFEAKNITTLTFGRENSLDFVIGTRLSRVMGVPNIRLECDERGIADQLKDSFPIGEGMYNAVPYHPVQSYRRAASDFPLILSGYMGDLIFGAYELSPDDRNELHRNPAHLLQIIHRMVDLSPPFEVRRLLANDDTDPLRTDQTYLQLEADSPENRYATWLWEYHKINRNFFSLELYRDRTFYLAPFTHRKVIDTAYLLPDEMRWKEHAYFDALRKAYPKLWAFPTKKNSGFPLTENPFPRIFAVRAFRRAMAELDHVFGELTGKVLYHHPRNNYSHPRELMLTRNRADVLAALSRLMERKPFNAAGIEAFRNQYEKKRLLPTHLLQGLLTVDLWYQHYET